MDASPFVESDVEKLNMNFYNRLLLCSYTPVSSPALASEPETIIIEMINFS